MAKKEKGKKPKHKEVVQTPRVIRFPAIWLSLIILLVYAGTFKFGYTELDDIIFINEFAQFNADITHLDDAFSRGVFAEKEDTYYRPILLQSFILNAQISGTNIQGYHVVNILLHILVIILLLRLFRVMDVPGRVAFVLCFLYAIHPVFVQAVSWVPGRNDTILGLFVLGFVINTLRYRQSENKWLLIGNLVWLLAALFTKESALFIPFALWVLMVSQKKLKIFEKHALYVYGVWVLAACIWFLVRSTAGLANTGFSPGDMGSNFLQRFPVLIQYLGKALLPFNQSVFPMMETTSYVFGLIAMAGCAVLIWRSNQEQRLIWLGGFAWFFILLLPVVLLPGTLNEQDFEHRLYVPVIGLIIAAALVLAKQVLSMRYMAAVAIIALVFIVLNIRHQQHFTSPLAFWEAAVESTPNSGYATMMLASRLEDTDKTRGEALMQHAYALDPNEKYINFYMGKLYLDRNQLDSASICLHRELEISAYYETYFQLSRLSFQQQDLQQSKLWMEKYLELNPTDAQASGNYVLLLLQLGERDAAIQFVDRKKKEGVALPEGIIPSQ